MATMTANLGLTKPDYADAADVGVLNGNFDLLDQAIAEDRKQIVRSGNVRNLLDNSDFRNPVNQRGQSSYTANSYTIDRWKLYQGRVSIVDSQYIMTTGQMYQLISGLDNDKIYTFAIENDAGIGVVCGKPSTLTESVIGNAVIKITSVDGAAEVVIQPSDGYDTAGAYWAAFYEGEYTAETLPPYVPKGYGAELLECMRYYQYYSHIGLTCRNNGFASVLLPVTMRITPSMAISARRLYTNTHADVSGSYANSLSVTPKYIYFANGFYDGFLTISCEGVSLSADL